MRMAGLGTMPAPAIRPKKPRFPANQRVGTPRERLDRPVHAAELMPFALNDLAKARAVGAILLTGYAQFAPGLQKFFNPLIFITIATSAHKQSTAYPQGGVSSAQRQRV